MATFNEVMDGNARLSHRRPKAPKALDHMRITHAENGGFIVEHHFKSSSGPYHEPESHVFGADEHKKLLAHVSKHIVGEHMEANKAGDKGTEHDTDRENSRSDAATTGNEKGDLPE